MFDALIKLEYYFTNLYVQLSRFVNNKLIKKQKSFIYEILHRWIILRTQIIKFFVKLHRFKTVVARIPFLKSILKLMLVCRPGKFLEPLNCSMRNVREKYHIYEIAPTHIISVILHDKRKIGFSAKLAIVLILSLYNRYHFYTLVNINIVKS